MPLEATQDHLTMSIGHAVGGIKQVLGMYDACQVSGNVWIRSHHALDCQLWQLNALLSSMLNSFFAGLSDYFWGRIPLCRSLQAIMVSHKVLADKICRNACDK